MFLPMAPESVFLMFSVRFSLSIFLFDISTDEIRKYPEKKSSYITKILINNVNAIIKSFFVFARRRFGLLKDFLIGGLRGADIGLKLRVCFILLFLSNIFV